MCEREYEERDHQIVCESTFLVVWSRCWSFFVRVQKNEKKGTSSFLHNCVDVGLCRRTFRERERERKRETNSISNSSNNNNNNNNNNKRCFLSLYSLLLV